jgi:preprotein translocase subunit SecD
VIDKKDAYKIPSLIRKVDSGLDLKQDSGQFQISYSESYRERILNQLVDQTVEIIRLRIDETGTLEPSLQRQGDLGILLQVPGLHEPGQLKRILGKTAKLTFHIVDEEASIDKALKGSIPYDDVLLKGDTGTDAKPIWYIVKAKPVLTGDTLINAQLATTTAPVVAFNFNTLGAKIFADVTTKNTGRRLAIVLDDKVISAPVINEPILGGSGSISGNFTISSANELALLLRAGALPAPITVEDETIVGPSLGEDSITFGKRAGLAALLAITTTMILLYGPLGAFASLALLVNLAFVLTTMGFLNATLTMPGIAGLILTLGMAVDTNVLIFERIKEEMATKSTVSYAIKQGFHHAFTTILDSNITTLIAAFFLYVFGSGLIRGFAITLSIGILSSMFTAITLTKLMIAASLRLRILR